MTKTQKLAGLFMTTVAVALIVNQVVNNFNFAV